MLVISDGDQQQFLCKHWSRVAFGVGWQSSRRDEGMEGQEEAAAEGRKERRMERKREKEGRKLIIN